MTSQIIRLPEVGNMTGLSRSTIYARMTEGQFPKSIPLGGRLVGWRRSDIQSWIDQQAAKAGYEVEGAKQ